MKKIFIVIALVLTMGLSAFAQKGEMSLGANLAYNTEAEITGVGIRYQYHLLDRLRMAPQFTYFIENDNRSAYAFDFDLHYFFPLEHMLTLYPLVGVSFTNVESFHTTDSGFGLNAGIGIQFPLSALVNVSAEYKRALLLDLEDQSTIAFSISYKF